MNEIMAKLAEVMAKQDSRQEKVENLLAAKPGEHPTGAAGQVSFDGTEDFPSFLAAFRAAANIHHWQGQVLADQLMTRLKGEPLKDCPQCMKRKYYRKQNHPFFYTS